MDLQAGNPLTQIHFADPGWVHLLWPVLGFVALLWWLERNRAGALDRFVSPLLQARLASVPGAGQRLARIVLLGLAAVCLVVAMMRPQWGLEVIESREAGAEIMIALDVSRSMLAEDAAPNRLERAKAEIRDLLELLDGDQIGLIAFAGRASVLSPLTPDFSFLRLALDNAGPGSVSRGGTQLEEPIRKAISGFGEAGDQSRSILLITDGEDHDSFPLEAARAAAERGIRILAIGFGDETGSEIPITDPQTGARQLLRDGDGRVVQSRLDGDLLRDIALATDGAYIPAGTGQLDLASIYQRHIAPLTRGRLDGSTRVVRNDAFQWPILAGLACLIAAIFATRRNAPGSPTAVGVTALAACGLAFVVAALPGPAVAQANTTSATPASPAQTEAEVEGSAASSPPGVEIPEDAREAYNLGIAALDDNSPAKALELLSAARGNAKTDGEVRFRATYNLGWAEVNTADGLLESDPQAALRHLQTAAGWFREAVDLRPEHEDSRYNLEIVMRRALELADSLAQKDERSIEQRLRELMSAQRQFLTGLRAGLQTEKGAGSTSPASNQQDLRRLYRGLATRELELLSDAEGLSRRISAESQQIKSLPDQEKTPQQALRGAQLELVQGHLHKARERMGQVRARLRRQQGERAYRRAAAANLSLTRAMDQLLAPATRLSALNADGTELARLTSALAAVQRQATDLTQSQPGIEVPPWLTLEHLSEEQEGILLRAGELDEVFTAGLEQLRDASSAAASQDQNGGALTPESDAAAEGSVEQKRMEQALTKAQPLVALARKAFENASTQLTNARPSEALRNQGEGLQALREAREHFLDLRQLIDLVYQDEKQVSGMLASLTGEPEAAQPAPLPPEQAVAITGAIHARNVERALRLNELFTDRMTEQPAATPPGQPGAPPAAGPGVQVLEQGYALLGKALEEMHAGQDILDQVTGNLPANKAELAPTLQPAENAVDEAITHLAELQRLFFNLLERLQDTAVRQQRLADDTETLSALGGAAASQTAGTGTPPAPAPDPAVTGPLQLRQEQLAQVSGGLAQALKQQAQAPSQPSPPAGGAQTAPGAPGTDAQAEQRKRFEEAAELVAAAGKHMNTAATKLTPESPELEAARGGQDQAIEHLAQAIELLSQPPPPQENQQQQQQNQQQDQQSQAQRQQGQNQGSRNDMARLLQGVRDREARRQQERAAGRTGGYEPVDKDW